MNHIKQQHPFPITPKQILIILSVFGVILFLSIALFAQPEKQSLTRDEIVEKINRIIDEEIRNTDLTGASISVYYKGAPLISRGVGFADEPNQIIATKHTGFRIGSITKVFTALSIMKLAEEKKLSLDDSIFKYLPDYQPKVLPNVNPDNRVRDLLTHHSGIPTLWLKDNHVEKTSLELTRGIPKALSQDYLIGNRREVYAYNNVAYALAGLVIESASGKPYDKYIREHFFEPFDMTDAHVFLPENQVNIALSHNDHQSEKSFEIVEIPSGSMIASASDMNRFMKALMDTWHDEEDDLMDAGTLKQMSVYQHKDVKYDLTNFQGIGFVVKERYGHKQISKGGGIQSFSSQLLMIPVLQMGAFVCSNDSEEGPDGYFSDVLADKILNALAGLEIKREKDPILKKTKKNFNSKLPQTGKFLFKNRFTALYHKGQTAYLFSGDKKYKLEPLGINQWKFDDIPLLIYSEQYGGYYINHGPWNTRLTPLKEYAPSNRLDTYKTHKYSTPAIFHKKISLELYYSESTTKGNYYYTVVSFNDEPKYRFIQHTLSDTLLQVQGKGYHCGLVTEFIDDQTIQFAGLTLKRETKALSKGKIESMPPKLE